MTTSTAGFWCEATNTATRPDVLDDMLAFNIAGTADPRRHRAIKDDDYDEFQQLQESTAGSWSKVDPPRAGRTTSSGR
jgi:hypothetical protein